MKEEEIAIRSEEVQEILGFVPNWMIRWGNTLVLILIIGLLLISWFVKYPDIIAAEVLVTTATPPEKIYAKNSGRFETILAKDGETVHDDQILAVIENSADHKDVLALKNVVDTFVIDKTDFYFPIEELPTLYLGDVDTDYAQFERSYTEYILNKDLQPFSNEIRANELSMGQTKRRLNILIRQRSLSKKELELQQTDLKRSGTLHEKGVISTQEYDLKQLEYLQAERSYSDLGSAISQLREDLGNSQKNLKGTKIDRTQEESGYLKSVVQSYNQLKKSIRDWELSYALKASIDGRVSFLSFWNQNQSVGQGDLVFTIVPQGDNSFVGKIKAPVQNSGKIKTGQTVNVKLANYPYAEFGMLQGTVQAISEVPDSEGNYLIDVKLPKTLVSSYGKKIEFKQEMRGTAEIITEDLRLIERFFYQLKNVLRR